jgi:hypothetical protein
MMRGSFMPASGSAAASAPSSADEVGEKDHQALPASQGDLLRARWMSSLSSGDPHGVANSVRDREAMLGGIRPDSSTLLGRQDRQQRARGRG